LLRAFEFLIVASLLVPFIDASAQELSGNIPLVEKTIQMSSVFTNDFLGDGDDRWRTGSFDVSLTFGGGDLRVLPEHALERYQVRARAEIIAPSNLVNPAATDRKYAGVLGLGLFTHFQKQEYDLYYGGELVFVGKSTGIGAFHKDIHEAFGVTPPSDAVLNGQISSAIYPTLHAGISKNLRSERSLLRPFAEVQTGVESFARIGVDAVFGNVMINDFMLRDSVSGQLISHSKVDNGNGFSFLVGADAAYVADSNYLPNSGASQFETFRPRVRAGVAWQTQSIDTFYGLTWLGKEFETQTDSQVVGSLNFRLNF
jgi:hypothetical protein